MRYGKRRSPKTDKKTLYFQVLSYLLSTYALEGVIAEVEAEITSFKQSEHMFAVRYLEISWENALSCGRVYEEAHLKGFFIEELHYSVRFAMRTY